jgi:hypothetical protein
VGEVTVCRDKDCRVCLRLGRNDMVRSFFSAIWQNGEVRGNDRYNTENFFKKFENIINK